MKLHTTLVIIISFYNEFLFPINITQYITYQLDVSINVPDPDCWCYFSELWPLKKI